MSRRPRSRSSLARRRPAADPRACVLVVCEGAKTEPKYFQSLQKEVRLLPLEMEIVGEGAAPKTVVERAVELRKTREREVRRHRQPFRYDHVWCVFDVERQHQNPTLAPALIQARDTGIHVALSNPCFEYWFLIHLCEHAAPLIDQDATIRELRKHLPHYAKGADIFARIWHGVDEADRRAKAIRDVHERAANERIKRDPSTEVDLLVSLLRRIAARPATRSP